MNMKKRENEIRDIYNNMNEKYLEKEKNNLYNKKMIDNFLNSLNGNQILDIGCGTGELLEYYSNRGFEVTGIDLSNKLLDITKKRVPNATLFNMSAFDISTINNVFDGISATYFLVHITQDNIEEIIQVFKNQLKDKGLLLLIFTDNNTAALKSDYVENYSLNEIKNILIASNFIIQFENTTIQDITINTLIAQKQIK